ncbi:MAG: hypothetical protein HY423_13400 [Candidatus Lambdaproteobacteria bacterium]|nr:hypothetical protein [Candidatus Lambdaproteobacteria bacterium]
MKGVDAQRAVQDFLATWPPFAELPPGNPSRRGLLRFLAEEDRREREAILVKVNPAYRLAGVYRALGILRNPRRAEELAEVLQLTATDLAAAIAQGNHVARLRLLMRGFEFGPGAASPRVRAQQTFLVEFWGLPIKGHGMKYSIYPNGVLYAGGGKTHEEMAREFVKAGLGSGTPESGGQIFRAGELVFLYDTRTQSFKGSVRPAAVGEAIRRAIHASGADDQRVTLTYNELSAGG